MDRSDVPMMESKMSNIPCLLTYWFILLMVLGGSTPILPLLFLPNPTLLILVQPFRLLRDMFRSLCPCMSMVDIYCLEWISVSHERTSPTANYLDSSVIPENATWVVPAWLVWSDWYVINSLEVYLSSRVDSSGVGGRFLR